jgi:hypothetical protein
MNINVFLRWLGRYAEISIGIFLYDKVLYSFLYGSVSYNGLHVDVTAWPKKRSSGANYDRLGVGLKGVSLIMRCAVYFTLPYTPMSFFGHVNQIYFMRVEYKSLVRLIGLADYPSF